jgi:hypothetical protein
MGDVKLGNLPQTNFERPVGLDEAAEHPTQAAGPGSSAVNAPQPPDYEKAMGGLSSQLLQTQVDDLARKGGPPMEPPQGGGPQPVSDWLLAQGKLPTDGTPGGGKKHAEDGPSSGGGSGGGASGGTGGPWAPGPTRDPSGQSFTDPTPSFSGAQDFLSNALSDFKVNTTMITSPQISIDAAANALLNPSSIPSTIANAVQSALNPSPPPPSLNPNAGPIPDGPPGPPPSPPGDYEAQPAEPVDDTGGGGSGGNPALGENDEDIKVV